MEVINDHIIKVQLINNIPKENTPRNGWCFKDKTGIFKDVTKGHESPTEIFKPGDSINSLFQIR